MISKHLTHHIILIGFKSVGKSVIGKKISNQIQKPFIDLDQKIEDQFKKNNHKKLTCRQIMLEVGQNDFRTLEHEALKDIINLNHWGEEHL
jgi:shikimate kinase